MMKITSISGVTRLIADTYALTLATDRPFVILENLNGERLAELFIFSSIHTNRSQDDTVKAGAWHVHSTPHEVIFTVNAVSNLWERKVYRFRCQPRRLVYEIEVEGSGEITQVDYFGGYFSGWVRWGSGFFWSGHHFNRGFNPEPNAEENYYFSPAESSVIDMTGVPLPGRSDWFFTPPPYAFALRSGEVWLGMGVEARPGSNSYTDYTYRGQETAFYLSLDYEGHTQANGYYRLPSIGFDFAADEYQALERHVHALQSSGAVRRAENQAQTPWWHTALASGFGETYTLSGLGAAWQKDYLQQSWYLRLGADGHSLTDGAVVPSPALMHLYRQSQASALLVSALHMLPQESSIPLWLNAEADGMAVTVGYRPEPDSLIRLVQPRRRSESRATFFLPHREKPRWWYEPIYCGWGSQCYLAAVKGGRAPDFARQPYYEEFLAALEANDVFPGTVVLDDKWQLTYGENAVDPSKWHDLPGFIRQRHERGQRVLLWIKAWDPEGLPPEACVTNRSGVAVALDPTSPECEQRMRASIRRMLSAEGYDADGFKIDFTARIPSGPGLHTYSGAWGLELMRAYLAIFADESARVKADALVMAHTPHPYLADLVDMIRLNDINTRKDVQPAMRHRARVARIACPDALIDTDNWPIADRASWQKYTELQPELGIPSLYYATHIDTTREPLEAADYALIRAQWQRYRENCKELADETGHFSYHALNH